MRDWMKKLGAARIFFALAAILACAGLAVYLVNSMTGYYEGGSPDVLIVVFTAVAAALLVSLLETAGKSGDLAVSLALLLVTVLLSVCVAQFCLDRVAVAADQWFLPGMSTDEKGACLAVAIAGVSLYCASAACVIAAGFTAGRLFEKQTTR